MQEYKLAYLAGLLDGEGTVYIQNDYRKKWKYDTRITISNCDGLIMEWLINNCGGLVQTTKAKKQNHHKLYRWWLKGPKALRLLHLIYPYLIIKKEHAELLFEFEKTKIDTQTLNNKQRREMIQALVPQREDIKRKISEACEKSKSRVYALASGLGAA